MESCSVLASSEARSHPAYEPANGQDLLYQYSSIGTTKGTIRLLVIRGGTGNEIDCELVDSTLDEHGLPFEAVSYTWGPEFVANSVRIGGRRLPVTFHLSLILRDLRLPDADRIIWVDAVCINQQNAVEKGHQVAQMKDIYRFAKCVLLCICRPIDYTNLLMDSLEQLQKSLDAPVSNDKQALAASWHDVQNATARRHLDSQSSDIGALLQRQVKALTVLQRQGLEYILNQPWFQRVWILQEVANASSAIVCCGGKSVSAAIFALSPKLLNVSIPFGQEGIVAEVLSLMTGPSKRNGFQDLYPLLRRFRGSHATVERDRIYALFGICQDVHIDTKINPDYVQPEKDLVHDTISYICRVEVSAVASISPINSISELLAELDDLDNTMLSYFLYSNDHSSAVSLLVHRGEYISVDAEMFDLASTDTMIKEGVVELLLQQRNADTLLSGWGTWTTTWVAAEYGHDALARSMLAKVCGIDDTVDGVQWKTRRFPELTGAIADLVTRLHMVLRRTRLHQAAKLGNTNLAALLLKAGASPDVVDDWNNSSLTFAAENDHISIVQLLIDNGADLNPEAIRGSLTPLSAAAKSGHETMVKFLLKSGAYFSLKDFGRDSEPLEQAAYHGREAIVRILLATGANDDDKSPAVLNSALWKAARGGQTSMLRFLFAAGATANEGNLSHTLTVVAQELAIGRPEFDAQELPNRELTARSLLEKGARSGKALCWAAMAGNEKFLQVLLEHGVGQANINQRFRLRYTGLRIGDHVECTPLAFATLQGNKDSVKLLLAHGANPNIKDSGGETPLSRAEEAGEKEIVDILRSESTGI